MDSFWFCHECNDGPYGNWQNVCQNCGITCRSDRIVEDTSVHQAPKTSDDKDQSTNEPKNPNFLDKSREKIVAPRTEKSTDQSRSDAPSEMSRAPQKIWSEELQRWLQVEYNAQHQRYLWNHYVNDQWVFFGWGPEVPAPAPHGRRDSGGHSDTHIQHSQPASVMRGVGEPIIGTYDVANPQPNSHYETLDFSFYVRSREFFTPGKVFSVLFTNSTGNDPTTYNDNKSFVNYGEFGRVQTRRFIIVRQRKAFCYAIPIFTYGGQGTKKLGIAPDDHAVAYSFGREPSLLPDEKELSKQPICIVMNSGVPKLSVGSRIFFGTHHPVQYNVKVKELGHVHPDHLVKLLGYWNMENIQMTEQAAQAIEAPDGSEDSEISLPANLNEGKSLETREQGSPNLDSADEKENLTSGTEKVTDQAAEASSDEEHENDELERQYFTKVDGIEHFAPRAEKGTDEATERDEISEPGILGFIKIDAQEKLVSRTEKVIDEAKEVPSDRRDEVDEPEKRNVLDLEGSNVLAWNPEEVVSYISLPINTKEGAIATPYRLHWVCSCGYKHYDDFVEVVPGSILRLVDLLQQNGVESSLHVPTDSIYSKSYTYYLSMRNMIVCLTNSIAKAIHSASGHTSCSSSTPVCAGLDSNIEVSSMNQRGQDIALSAAPGTSSRGQGCHPSSSAQCATAQQGPASSQNNYMLLCSDQKRWLTTWQGLNVSQIKSDRELFENFRTSLNGRKRWMRRCMSLKTVQRISFVKFALRRDQEVDQIQYNQIPPLAENQYDFYKRVPGYIPPIGNRYLMHRFSSPAHCKDGVFCLTQIPKRVNGRPAYGSAPDDSTAWGLYFEDALDLKRMCFCGAVAFVLSLVFGVAWAAGTKSVQSGFAIASYMLAFEALTVGTVQVAVSLE